MRPNDLDTFRYIAPVEPPDDPRAVADTVAQQLKASDKWWFGW